MSLISLPTLANWQLSLDDSEERLILTGVTWEQYEQLLTAFGDSSTYRTTYLAGTLEIMSPSRRHEISKKNIARLLELYLEEAEIDFLGLGSTTFRRQEGEAGKEPDECFCIGTEKDLPDIAIEVVVTSKKDNILAVYLLLGVKEVWFWENEQLKVYVLENNQYYLREKSVILPQLDLKMLSQFVNHPNPRLAVKQFRELLR